MLCMYYLFDTFVLKYHIELLYVRAKYLIVSMANDY